MGARYITPTEFAYIKELLGKYKHDSKKVSEMTQRSRGTICQIDNSVTFEAYSNPNSEPDVKKEAPEKSEAKKSTLHQYDGAILSEMARLRKAIEKLTETIESKPTKRGLFG
jgi:hypothetical protein